MFGMRAVWPSVMASSTAAWSAFAPARTTSARPQALDSYVMMSVHGRPPEASPQPHRPSGPHPHVPGGEHISPPGQTGGSGGVVMPHVPGGPPLNSPWPTGGGESGGSGHMNFRTAVDALFASVHRYLMGVHPSFRAFQVARFVPVYAF
ncbi:MAG: hypothetical protein HQM16_01290 [Deltaproteobacteria bacterium]|nr:hypothetical protein [Deltaproteobacteria bacterium]